jgi:hypothetical protein
MASGRIIAGFFIRACIFALLQVTVRVVLNPGCHIGRVSFVTAMTKLAGGM